MSVPTDDFLGELRLGRELTRPIQVAAGGSIILIGLLILLLDRSIGLLNSWGLLSSLLSAAVFGLTLLNTVELLGGSRERGGIYVIVHETLGGLPAFLTGWGILAGGAALAAALLKEAASISFLTLSFGGLSTSVIALGVFIVLVLLQVFQLIPRWIPNWVVASLLILLLAVASLSALPKVNPRLYRSSRPVNIGDLDQAAAWLCVGFVAFETLLASRRQIRDPAQTLPRAIVIIFILWGMLFTLVFLMVSSLNPSAIPGDNLLVNRLSAAGFLPDWFISGLAITALVLGANGCLMTTVRQTHALSLEGAFPANFRRVWGPFPIPMSLFGVMTVLIIPLLFLAPVNWLIHVAAALMILVMMILNSTAIYSHQTEPERRRPFRVPLSPLAPALGILLTLILVSSLAPLTWLSVLIWLLIGSGVYLGYARYHLVVAKEGETVFGRIGQPESKERGYRILVPLGPEEERHLILRMATNLAHQLDGEVIPLQVIPTPDPLAIEEGRRIAQERNVLFQWSTRVADDIGVPIHPITRLARSVAEGIIDTVAEEGCNLVMMSWFVTSSGQDARIGGVLSSVARRAPSDVAVVAYHPDRIQLMKTESESSSSEASGLSAVREVGFRPKKILVPTSGGPHAPLAIQLALLLARESDATVTAAYVASPEAEEQEIANGNQLIQQTIDRMREQSGDLPLPREGEQGFKRIAIQGRIITADNVISGIAEASKEYDLIMIGSSEESLIDQMLFGSVPEEVAKESSSPVIIVKSNPGLPRLWLRRMWDTLYEALPTLDLDEQIEVYRNIHRDARPDIDFFVMIGLSALIATFGLLQNSSAVIIGAMLVAPLFSPLIAVSLSIIQGNARLLRLAIESTVQGIALSIGLAFVLAALSPFKTATPEIIARSHPNLFDLAVALASGAAGAYAVARKDVAAALPGVAIAAALLPPLGVVGIGFAMGDLAVAGGGSLLFVTNLIAIALAGSITFLLLGFRPGTHGVREIQLRRGLATTIVLFLLITIPLGFFFVQSIKNFRTQQEIQNVLIQQFKENTDIELVNPDNIEVSYQQESLSVTVPIYTTVVIPDTLVQLLNDNLTNTIGRKVQVRLVIYNVVEAPP